MPRLDRLSQMGRNNLLTFPARVNDTAPFVRPAKPLAACRVAIMRDPNVTFPVDRLRELVARGQLGGLGPNNYSVMGALREASRIEGETGPEVGRRLRDEGVDAVLITPT